MDTLQTALKLTSGFTVLLPLDKLTQGHPVFAKVLPSWATEPASGGIWPTLLDKGQSVMAAFPGGFQ
jgi:hypothetical protein